MIAAIPHLVSGEGNPPEIHKLFLGALGVMAVHPSSP
jgi:hypothetical protein